MRAIIVVTRHPTLQNVYWVSSTGAGARPGRIDVRDPSAAAAKAVEIAMRAGRGYQIFGPAEVIDQVPADMRSRA